MSAQDEWVNAFAAQARADLRTWSIIRSNAEIPDCHKLQFFQMACEKLCKAHRLQASTTLEQIRGHAQMANFLGTILIQEIVRLGGKRKQFRGFLEYVNHLVKELDALSPAVDQGGKREDNCEYPWEDATGKVHSPLGWSFPAAKSLAKPEHQKLVGLMESSLENLLS